jgi:predicted CXXCH cytochrome family protein
MQKRLSWIVTLATLALFFGVLFAANMVRSKEQSGDAKEPTYMEGYIGADATIVGTSVCAKCHPNRLPAEGTTTHFTILNTMKDSPYKDHECESCHGPGSKHNGNPKGILNPLKMTREDVVDLCSKCHSELRTYKKDAFLESKHFVDGGLGCLNCHSGHSVNADFILKESVPDLCATCHADEYDLFKQGKHNGADPEKMVCSVCHNPHK